MIDLLTTTAATASVAFVGIASAGWHLWRRIRRVEAQAAQLRRQLRAEFHAANHDPLTGLPNRRGFFRRGEALVADPARHPLVAVVLDLDDFKQVNDRLGHAVGDQVLIVIARRFAMWAAHGAVPAGNDNHARAADNLVGRLGGDEFAGLLSTTAADQGWLPHASWQLTKALAAPITVAGRQVCITAAVGMSPVPAATSLSDALRHADAAMYRAKSGGRAGLPVRVGGEATHRPPQPDARGHPATYRAHTTAGASARSE